MKKLIPIFLLLLLSSWSLTAQVVFGVREGEAYSSMVQKTEGVYHVGSKFGYSVAGLAEIHLYKRLSLRPEVAFVKQGGSFLSDYEVDGVRNTYSDCSVYSLQVPMNLSFTFPVYDVKLSFLTGPVADVPLFGKIKTQNQHEDISFGNKEGKDLRPFDLGIDAGLIVEYKNCFFSIIGTFGTIDRLPGKHNNQSPLYQNNATFSLGYMFR